MKHAHCRPPRRILRLMQSTLATTHVAVDQPLDLPLTLESGQAFRWHNDGGVWSGFIERRLLTLERDDPGLRVTFDPQAHPDADRAVRAYFRLDDDLPSIYAQLCEDERLAAAVRQHWGLRILRQDPWECLIAFICSQNSNIPRIAGTQERLASTLGEEATLGLLTRRAFPSPKTLASAGEQRLRELGLGYRARYVAGTAEVVAAGRLDLPATPDRALRRRQGSAARAARRGRKGRRLRPALRAGQVGRRAHRPLGAPRAGGLVPRRPASQLPGALGMDARGLRAERGIRAAIPLLPPPGVGASERAA